MATVSRGVGHEAPPTGADDTEEPVHTVDLERSTVRELNAELHAPRARRYEVLGSRGAHAVAAGLTEDLEVTVRGHVGYYCAGMNQRASVVVDGSAGTGVAENMMSGSVRVRGDASQSAGATGRGGLLVVEGRTSLRCGISMKGIDIVVGRDIGAMGAFMAQAGRLVVCGDAGDGLGDSIYEARLFVRGSVGTLGADCVEKPMRPEHHEELTDLLRRAGMPYESGEFRRYGSARSLYHFTSEHSDVY